MTDETKFILFNKEVIQLTKNKYSGLWSDGSGTVYAYNDGNTADPVQRCGVKPYAIPKWAFFESLNQACSPHDFAYSSKAYQAFHTREEADQYLKSLVSQSYFPFLKSVFYYLSRKFGSTWWENPRTND